MPQRKKRQTLLNSTNSNTNKNKNKTIVKSNIKSQPQPKPKPQPQPTTTKLKEEIKKPKKEKLNRQITTNSFDDSSDSFDDIPNNKKEENIQPITSLPKKKEEKKIIQPIKTTNYEIENENINSKKIT